MVEAPRSLEMCCLKLKVAYHAQKISVDFMYCLRQSKTSNLEKLIHAVLGLEEEECSNLRLELADPRIDIMHLGDDVLVDYLKRNTAEYVVC